MAGLGAEFWLTSFLVVLAPGTGVVYTVATGIALGRGASLWAAIGCTFGIVPAMLASVLGLAAVLHASALLFTAVKFAGVAFLLYLAWQTWNDRGALSFEGGPTPERRGWKIARTGALINVLNPKLSVFFMAFLPQFVDPGAGGVTGQLVAMGLAFMALTFAVFVVYGMLAAQIRAAIRARPAILAWMRRTVAVAFAGFGARLALAER